MEEPQDLQEPMVVQASGRKRNLSVLSVGDSTPVYKKGKFPTTIPSLPSTANLSITPSGIQSAISRSQAANLHATLEKLNKILKAYGDYCPVCIAIFGQVKAKPELTSNKQRKYFGDCYRECHSYFVAPRTAFKWIDLKRVIQEMLKTPPYCHHCTLPYSASKKRTLTCHQFSQTTRKCNLEDYLVLFAWALYHNPDKFKQMCRALNFTPRLESSNTLDYNDPELNPFVDQYGRWLSAEIDDVITLHRVVIWYFTTFHNLNL